MEFVTKVQRNGTRPDGSDKLSVWLPKKINELALLPGERVVMTIERKRDIQVPEIEHELQEVLIKKNSSESMILPLKKIVIDKPVTEKIVIPIKPIPAKKDLTEQERDYVDKLNLCISNNNGYLLRSIKSQGVNEFGQERAQELEKVAKR